VEDSIELRRQLSIGAWAWANPAWCTRGSHTTVDPEPLRIRTGQVIYRDAKNQIRQEVELLAFDELEMWMRGRVMDLLALYDGEQPEAEANWRCNTCQVRQFCPVGPTPKRRRA
jgi:hypothetical protein